MMTAFSRLSKFLLVTSSVLVAQFHGVSAVCASGQMAVGTAFFQQFTGPSGSFNVYSGFEMTTNCALIAQSTSTQNENQMCNHSGWPNGASITCNSNHEPISAVDTIGQHWTCSPTNDQSCNTGGSGGRFQVLACCNRA
ncbi:hypothetical protein BDP27DRAFT_1332864 [Rhodocollybia butyracea]|uniref:Secreted protein n=1 Tax=Rhodocollybia butyracea TaxID=206335 RepID=A0A9P5PGF1_9AGAR|nr:hypothetical protein BDP27DRAFT_1332864 [Rhodocollybia butyracea]